MSGQTLEERVAKLEQQMHRLLGQRGREENPEFRDTADGTSAGVPEPGPEDWHGTVGAFRGDAIVQEMIDDATRRREEERRQVREDAERESA